MTASLGSPTSAVGRLGLCVLFSLALGACGDDSAPADSGTHDTGTADTGSADSGGHDSGPVDSSVDSGSTDSSVDSGAVSPCPVAQPSEGDACTREGLACGYGDDPRVECRPVATCTSAQWTIDTPSCSTLPPVTCPATREAASGADCTPDGAYCDYDGLACQCTNCTDGPAVMCSGPTVWHCDAPNADPQCPAAIPRLGDACDKPAQMCIYGCASGMSRTCTDGVWVSSSSPGGCPVSARRAKRDIHYLSTAEADAVAAQVRRTRLATWEYIDPALRGRTHLGFILEDQPGSYAEDPEARMVDLYGYTSMLLATTQAQQRQIDALTQQLDALQRRVASDGQCVAPTPPEAH